jgi:tryptophan 2-monooxygenase
MASAFPSLSAFRGASGIGKLKAKRAEGPTDQPLSALKSGYARMVDTFIYEYPRLVRDCEPFAKVNGAGENVKVAVIGAGFAGATAVYELRRAGISDITVYEGRDRVGGRADSRTLCQSTATETLEYVSEMGPMRVPSNSKLFWHYFAETVKDDEDQGDDPIQKIFPNPGVVPTELVYRGVRYTWKDEGVPQPPKNPGEEVVDWGQLSNEVLVEFYNSFQSGCTPDGEIINIDYVAKLLQRRVLTEEQKQQIRSFWSHFLTEYDPVSFVGALEAYFGERWGATEYNMFSTLGLGTGGFGPLFPVCFLEILRLFLWQYEDEYSPSLPMEQIVQRLLCLDPGNGTPEPDVRVDTMVTYVGLNESGDQVHVYTNKSPMNKKEPPTPIPDTYDYVIIATPLRSMQISMNLDAEVAPKLYSASRMAVFGGEENDMLRESLRIPHIMNSSKLFGFLPKKPWDEDPNWPTHNGEEVKCVLTDTLARQMYYLDPYPDNSEAGCNVLISYNWGDDSVKIMGILDTDYKQDPASSANFNLKKAYQTALETVIRDNPVATSLEQITSTSPEDHLQSVVWQQEPMIFGAFKLDYPNQFYYISQLAYQYQYANSTEKEHSKRVYIAGNNVSFQGGWIEGAMQSAVNAASAVLKDMSNKDLVEEGSFRMDNLFEPNPFQDMLRTLDRRYKLPRRSR